jgi:kojibiose phosphorylase
MAAKMTMLSTAAAVSVINTADCLTLTTTFLATVGQTVSVEKVVTVFTSQEVAQPLPMAQAKLADLSAYAVLLAAHQQAWQGVWQQSDIEIEGDRTVQLAVRYNLFQLFIGACSNDRWASPHNMSDSVPAKTLST